MVLLRMGRGSFNCLEMLHLFPNSHNPLGCCLQNAKSPLFYSGLMSTMHTSYFHTAVPMQAESTAGFSGKLLILAGYASLLFLLPMYSFPPITFPVLQRFNKDYKTESQQEKLLSADKEAKGSFCCYFQQRQEVQRDLIFRLALLWHKSSMLYYRVQFFSSVFGKY